MEFSAREYKGQGKTGAVSRIEVKGVFLDFLLHKGRLEH